ncbi:hypothetical protein FRC02_003731 [Tulasnella sp. 418]|nr:hypothetical protein FRC02_003731 [Tulasnella sp. 418]
MDAAKRILHRLYPDVILSTYTTHLIGGQPKTPTQAGEGMEEDKKVSTSGRRLSRRAEWRLSKGMPVNGRSSRLNRQGIPVAQRKSGRSKRRR